MDGRLVFNFARMWHSCVKSSGISKNLKTVQRGFKKDISSGDSKRQSSGVSKRFSDGSAPGLISVPDVWVFRCAEIKDQSDGASEMMKKRHRPNIW
jgi:hypothetical protein